jgi:hypothetical protein
MPSRRLPRPAAPPARRAARVPPAIFRKASPA